jgi:hypothetical protein
VIEDLTMAPAFRVREREANAYPKGSAALDFTSISRGEVVRNGPFVAFKVTVKRGLPCSKLHLQRKAPSNSSSMAIGVDLAIVAVVLEMRDPEIRWMKSVRSTMLAITPRVTVNAHAMMHWLMV